MARHPKLGRERPPQNIAFPGVLLGNDGLFGDIYIISQEVSLHQNQYSWEYPAAREREFIMQDV